MQIPRSSSTRLRRDYGRLGMTKEDDPAGTTKVVLYAKIIGSKGTSWRPTADDGRLKMLDELTQQYTTLKTKVHDLREYL